MPYSSLSASAYPSQPCPPCFSTYKRRCASEVAMVCLWPLPLTRAAWSGLGHAVMGNACALGKSVVAHAVVSVGYALVA
ncbi:hypothetical protein VTI28DRAFT_5914 [Corynascus sepedonium]